jgi:hypothetical protein
MNFQQTPSTEGKLQPEVTFFHVSVLTYLPIAKIFVSFVEVWRQ